MRTITNRANLPLPFYNACAHDGYVGGGDISVTRLISPVRIVTLTKAHEDEIVEDAADRVWSLLGKAAHKVLELSKGDEPGIVVETRLSMPFKGILSSTNAPIMWRLSGQPDVFYNSTLYDYKITSVWALVFGKTEWDWQINMQAMLHRHKGDTVNQAYIVAIMRDWQKRKAQYEKEYPQEAAKMIGIPLWTQEEAIEYATKRIKMHQQAQADYAMSGQDESVLPLCTPEERWYRGSKWAVKKMDSKGKINKKADRVFDNLTDAEQFKIDNALSLPKGKVFAPVEERPGQNIRCMSYCPVWFKCGFGIKLHEQAQAKASLTNETSEESED